MSQKKIIDAVGHDDGSVTWTEVVTTTEGIETRLVHAFPSTFERTNCYCCSCPEDFLTAMISTDPYCRNHGYGFGERPCEEHSMPGLPEEREIKTTEGGSVFIGPMPMPATVEEFRREHEHVPEIP